MRYRRLGISGAMLVSIFEQGLESHVRCIAGVPKETKFIHSYRDVHDYSLYGLIWIVIEHPSFDLLKPGDEIPIFIAPEFESIR